MRTMFYVNGPDGRIYYSPHGDDANIGSVSEPKRCHPVRPSRTRRSLSGWVALTGHGRVLTRAERRELNRLTARRGGHR